MFIAFTRLILLYGLVTHLPIYNKEYLHSHQLRLAGEAVEAMGMG